MVLRGGREDVVAPDIDTEEVCMGARAVGGVDVAGAVTRKMYTCPGGADCTDCRLPALRFCVELSARGYLNQELPFV